MMSSLLVPLNLCLLVSWLSTSNLYLPFAHLSHSFCHLFLVFSTISFFASFAVGLVCSLSPSPSAALLARSSALSFPWKPLWLGSHPTEIVVPLLAHSLAAM